MMGVCDHILRKKECLRVFKIRGRMDDPADHRQQRFFNFNPPFLQAQGDPTHAFLLNGGRFREFEMDR